MTDAAEALAASWRRSLTAAGKSPRTIEGYTTIQAQFTAWSRANGDPDDPSEQKRADVEEFIGELLATKAHGTAARRFRNLRAWFNWLVDEGKIDVSPMAGLRQPKVDAKVVPTIKDEDLTKLLDTCRTDKTIIGRRDYAVLRILVSTGMRRGELAALDLADVNLDGGVLFVHQFRHSFARRAKSTVSTIDNRGRRAYVDLSPSPGASRDQPLTKGLQEGRLPVQGRAESDATRSAGDLVPAGSRTWE